MSQIDWLSQYQYGQLIGCHITNTNSLFVVTVPILSADWFSPILTAEWLSQYQILTADWLSHDQY